ncbi:MAG: thioredoxin family protein [Bdellovibrionaceae bacterium]|nr:thioredoxin family protein [Bdellovibrio sp.]
MPVYTPEKIEFGQACPDFKLPAVDGKTYQLANFQNQNPLLILFICNHCPYVKAIEDRLITLGHDLKNLNINMVAICSNDEVSYPEDSFANLKKRAEVKKYPFYYLHDQSQAVAKTIGAICTPDYFLYDHNTKLAYRGRLDDSWKDETQVKTRELYEAALELSQNKKISRPQTPSMGCSIKWIKS